MRAALFLFLLHCISLYCLSRRRPGHRFLYEVCVLSARRPHNASYVRNTLASLQRERMGDVTVVDVDGAADLSGFAVKAPLVDRERAGCVDDGKDVAAGVPCRVHQGNLDAAAALHACYVEAAASRKRWVLFLEDDVEACEGSRLEVENALREARHVAAVKFSKYSRAFAVDLRQIHDLAREIVRQADVAPYEFVVFGNRWNGVPNVFQIHPTNLFHHVGAVSTVQFRNERAYIKVYGKMKGDVCGERLY